MVRPKGLELCRGQFRVSYPIPLRPTNRCALCQSEKIQFIMCRAVLADAAAVRVGVRVNLHGILRDCTN